MIFFRREYRRLVNEGEEGAGVGPDVVSRGRREALANRLVAADGRPTYASPVPTPWPRAAGCRPRAKNCWCSWLIKNGEPGITCIFLGSGSSETEEEAISRSR